MSMPFFKQCLLVNINLILGVPIKRKSDFFRHAFGSSKSLDQDHLDVFQAGLGLKGNQHKTFS